MLTAGVEVLLRDGINLGASTVRYPDAFALLAERGIKVTRGSVHERLWSSQEAWQLEVISETITRNDERGRKVLAESITSLIRDLPIDTTEQRCHVLAESCRVGALAFMEDAMSAPEQRLLPTVIAAWKASSSAIPEHNELHQQLRRLQASISSQLIADATSLANYLGLEVNPTRGLSMDEAIRAFCATTTALAYSQTIRVCHDPGLTELFMAKGPDGERRPWNVLGMGYWLIARGLFHCGDNEGAS